MAAAKSWAERAVYSVSDDSAYDSAEFVRIFPLAILIVLHVSEFHVIGGMLVSWLACNLGAILVYFLFRRYLYGWFDEKWRSKLKRYDKWQRYLDRYGIWTLVLLRTIPIVPSNVINFMAAVSPIKASSYIWGTVLGNLSFIWLFGTIGSSLVVPREEWNGFLALICGFYYYFAGYLYPAALGPSAGG